MQYNNHVLLYDEVTLYVSLMLISYYYAYPSIALISMNASASVDLH